MGGESLAIVDGELVADGVEANGRGEMLVLDDAPDEDGCLARVDEGAAGVEEDIAGDCLGFSGE